MDEPKHTYIHTHHTTPHHTITLHCITLIAYIHTYIHTHMHTYIHVYIIQVVYIFFCTGGDAMCAEVAQVILR